MFNSFQLDTVYPSHSCNSSNFLLFLYNILYFALVSFRNVALSSIIMPPDISKTPFELFNIMPINLSDIPKLLICSLIHAFFLCIAVMSVLLTIITSLYFVYFRNTGNTFCFNFSVLKNSSSPNTLTISFSGISGYTSLKSHLPISSTLTFLLYLLFIMRKTFSTDIAIVSSKSIKIFIAEFSPYCINSFRPLCL